MESEQPEYKARCSRLQKWKELVAQAQEDLEVPVKPVERLQ